MIHRGLIRIAQVGLAAVARFEGCDAGMEGRGEDARVHLEVAVAAAGRRLLGELGPADAQPGSLGRGAVRRLCR